MDTLSNLIFIAILFTHSVFVSASEPETLVNTKDELPVLDFPGRSVGVENTNIKDHPFQVSILINNSSFCGGFIASENYILTAAHCVVNCGPSDLVLRAGSSSWRNGTIIPIAKVTLNPKYNESLYDKDVAVLKTQRPIEFTEQIKAIPLPPKDRLVEGGTYITVSGWGYNKPRTFFQEGISSLSEELTQFHIPVVAYSQCEKTYRTLLTENMFCSGNFVYDASNTCQGYFGGAAVQNGMAVGILSFGQGCHQAGPNVFTNIAASKIRDFIKEETGL